MREQARRFGAKVKFESIEKVDLSSRPFRLETDGGEAHSADALIVATGARAKLLGLDSETELWDEMEALY